MGSDSQTSHSVQTRLLSVLLNELDGVGVKTLERRGTGKVLQVEGAEECHAEKQVIEENMSIVNHII